MPGDLYYGDNLEVLRHKVASESVDLVYLDPPFNSARSYNLIHKDSKAQQHAFVDTWHWEDSAERAFAELTGQAPQGVRVPQELTRMMSALKEFLWQDQRDTLAYLSMMAIRLVEMRRVLRATGSLYLHCDPTASHYLKVILDSIFGANRFVNEIVWKRATTVKGNFGQGAKSWPSATDSILFYSRSEARTFRPTFTEYSEEYKKTAYRYVEEKTGRRYRLVSMIGPGGAAKGNPIYEVLGVTRYWRYSRDKMAELIASGLVVQTRPGGVPNRKYYLDEGKGVPVQSLWDDIGNLQAADAERIGYPTQKPVALLERIIQASSSVGETVLDPFCGCGTTIEAAENLGRKWLGIDVAIRAVDVIKDRLDLKFQPRVWSEHGEPSDVDGAAHLADTNPYDFQWWSLRRLGGQPPKGEKKKGGDGGVDGEMTLRDFETNVHRRVLVSVKGGRTLTPEMVKGLESTVRLEKADYGILVTMHQPTSGMRALAREFGTVSATAQRDGKLEHRIRIITVPELLAGTFKLPGLNITPRSHSAPPPAEPRVGDNLQLPFPAHSSVKKAKPRTKGPGVRSAPAVAETVLSVADGVKARLKHR